MADTAAGTYAVALHPAPPLTQVVRYADVMRTAALACLPGAVDAPMLAGRARGGAAPGQHVHTHWLPYTTDAVRLTGLVAWCPAGWSSVEERALRAVRHLAAVRATVTPTVVSWPQPSTWWASLTAYVPGRHDTPLAEDITRECQFRGLPAPAGVWELPARGRWATARPSRRYDRLPPQPRQVACRFHTPVPAPLALGRLCHFGLGMFWPVNPAVLAERFGVPCS